MGKFYEGQKVKIVANTCGHGNKIGDIVTLVEAKDLGEGMWDLEDEHGWYFDEDDCVPHVVERVTLQKLVEEHGINLHEEGVVIVLADGTLELALEDGTLDIRVTEVDRVILETGLTVGDIL